jgi:prevent-host-death family protein
METSNIAHAKNNLPKLIHTVESGEDIMISRHGKPVAVLVSIARYEQHINNKADLFQAIIAWREQYLGIELNDDEIDGWRDHHAKDRGFTWD